MRLIKNSVFDNSEYEKVPILFIPFSKTETAIKVFNAIKKSKPNKLYVFSDGWREDREGEREKVQYLRQYVLDNIDWNCEIFTKFEDKNLGTRFGIEAAIDWFFENEEMGIILEDDCLPTPSFFRFCAEMLVKYKDEEKIFLINGTNETAKNVSANSYSFKRVYDFAEDVTGIWGWASWRRAWKKHDKKMSNLQEYKKQNEINENTLSYEEYLKRIRMKNITNQMEFILSGENNTWDIQLIFSTMIADGLFIVPDCNLVTNIGCSISQSAHKVFKYSVGVNLTAGEIVFPLSHPPQILPQTLTPKDYIRAAFVPNFAAKEFWEIETCVTDRILTVHNFLARSFLPNEQKLELYRQFLGDNLFELINNSLLFKEYAKAQKYFYLSLTESVLKGEKNICLKCRDRKCLSACPSNCIFPSQNSDKEFIVKINENTCESCRKCMRACPVVNPT
ncbi:MAG: hypothetical protein FWF51_00820 [Chitinivibrionia bacterium]|nr:hypothetical protein [Chitinivibrionia bacterium]